MKNQEIKNQIEMQIYNLQKALEELNKSNADKYFVIGQLDDASYHLSNLKKQIDEEGLED